MSILKNFSWLGGATFLDASLAFAANLILVRLLLPSEFGEFAVLFAEVGFVAALVELRFNTLIISQRNTNDSEAVKRLVSLSVVWSLVVLLFLLTYLWMRGNFNGATILLSFGIFLNSLSSAQLASNEREFNYKNLALLQSCTHFFSHVVAVLLAFLGFGVLALILRLLVRPLFLNLFYLFTRGISTYSIRPARLADLKGHFINGGIALWIDGFIEQSVERAAILALDFFYSKEVVGFFYQAKRLALLPDQFFGGVVTRLTLNYYSNNFSEKLIKRQVLPTLVIALIYCMLVGVGIVVIAGPLIPILFGDGWDPVALMIVYLIPFSCGISILHMYRAQIYSRGEFMKFVIHGRVPQMLVFSLGFLTVVHSTVNQNIFISFYAFAFLLAGFYAGLCSYRLIAGSNAHENN